MSAARERKQRTQRCCSPVPTQSPQTITATQNTPSIEPARCALDVSAWRNPSGERALEAGAAEGCEGERYVISCTISQRSSWWQATAFHGWKKREQVVHAVARESLRWLQTGQWSTVTGWRAGLLTEGRTTGCNS